MRHEACEILECVHEVCVMQRNYCMAWHRDAGLESRLRAYFGDNITAAHLKMAEAPQGES